MTKDKTIQPGGVEEYIASCPKDVQEKLRVVRAAILEVAPDAVETVSYFLQSILRLRVSLAFVQKLTSASLAVMKSKS